MSQYQQLDVWKLSVQLVGKVYKLTKTFPIAEQFGLTSQIRRSATSIPANIAEGYGRLTSGDYLRFLSIARGSLFELETHLHVAIEVQLLDKADCEIYFAEIQRIGKMLTGLIRSIRQKDQSSLRELSADYDFDSR